MAKARERLVTTDRALAGRVACFIAGARILTDLGPIAVDALCSGDRVVTLDHGLQTLLGCDRRTVPSQGRFAAVSVPAGTFGAHGALRVLPQHRILLTGWQAELYNGEDEVLVRAVDLVRAGLLRQDASGCPVTCFHLRFDRQVTVNAEGLWGESYLDAAKPPVTQTPDARSDVLTRFPKPGSGPASANRVAVTTAPGREGRDGHGRGAA